MSGRTRRSTIPLARTKSPPPALSVDHRAGDVAGAVAAGGQTTTQVEQVEPTATRLPLVTTTITATPTAVLPTATPTQLPGPMIMLPLPLLLQVAVLYRVSVNQQLQLFQLNLKPSATDLW